MRIKVILAVAVVLIPALVFLIPREEEDVPLAVVSGFRIAGSLLQVVFTNRSPQEVTVWPVEIEIKAGNAWTNYNDSLQPVMHVATPYSHLVVTKMLPSVGCTGRLSVIFATPLPNWKLTVNEWSQRVGMRPIFSYEQKSLTTPEFSRVD